MAPVPTNSGDGVRDRRGAFAAVEGLRLAGEVSDVVPVRRTRTGQPTVDDVAAATRHALGPVRPRVAPGDRIAVTAGSRGIRDIAAVVRAAVAWLRDAGAEPFVVPAMGSHGGGTAEGQRAVLADLGIVESTVGAPVVATMETVEVGRLPNGVPVHHDAAVAAADGVLLVNRVKPHTDYHGPVESGLAKILAIGLGNHRGAQSLHAGGVAELGATIKAAADLVLAQGTVLGGLGIVENAAERTAAVELVLPEQIGGPGETALLRRAGELLARLPFTDIDVLVVDLMGKDRSGTGMDTNVLGRCWVPGVPEFAQPRITVVTVHGLSSGSHGNAAGIGLADLAPVRLLDGIDVRASYLNAITSGTGGLRRSRMPMLLADDAAVLRAATAMCGRRDRSDVRLARIRDTLTPDDLLVSPALLPEVAAHPELAVIGEPRPLVTAAGELAPWPVTTSVPTGERQRP
jgi:hypothetical protein